MKLSVELAPRCKRGLLLANPVMAASGTFGYGLEMAKELDIQRLGAIVCKGTTLRRRRGNPQPRTVETPAGMLNSIGLQNMGVEALIRDIAPIWATWRVPVVVNIAGESVEEYARLARRLDGVAGVSGLELNISCPNVATGMVFGSSLQMTAEVTAAVRRETTLPVIVKLTPNVSDISSVARAAADAGADALTLINTFPAMAIDVKNRRPSLGWTFGGLSGPALKPIALRLVYQTAAVVDVPLIGCGGIMTGLDAIEYIMAGASAVQVGTATFVNPRATLDVSEGIERFMQEEGVTDVHELIGAARV
ncbi:MAG: dihydroorotate dehydrogenase [Dehalococcoidia bacterium]|nr:MAG: dihydroorotate dehydrogenase [Dehalococcoidia bacterium]